MGTPQVFTREELAGLFEGQGYDYPEREQALRLIDRWVERGDGCAIYRNEEIGNLNLGDLKFVSFGSDAAQIPTGGDLPPARMPDIGSEINWRYVLWGTYGASQDRPAVGGSATVTDISNHPSNSAWTPVVESDRD